jgi:2-polyprenyl-3-methyl-5-hydroxy-6-metoxy-1,4-benzoquinol methylase
VQVISSLKELDAKLVECDGAARISDDALRATFDTFRMDFTTAVPPDPFSPEYREFQMELYATISSRRYDPRNEVSKFDLESADRTPFPFSTRSSKTAGSFMMATGFLLHSLDLPPGARVVEFGPGWGNTTIAMAMAGLDVTAVDIESNFCDLLRRRAKRHDVSIDVVNADFMWAETVQDPFDAAIFFECFHHCADHMRLLNALRTTVKPDGVVYFGSEPIVPDFPLPWGLRMDGESLWAIRKNGWMELGYNEAYFREALERTGWIGTKHVCTEIGWASVWEARRAEVTSQVVQLQPAPEQVQNNGAQNEAEISLRRELDAIYRSTSWRITAPLRAFGSLFRH